MDDEDDWLEISHETQYGTDISWYDKYNDLRKTKYSSGYVAYYKKGMWHNERGPARIKTDGRVEWWFNNKKIPCNSQEEFEKYMKLKTFL